MSYSEIDELNIIAKYHPDSKIRVERGKELVDAYYRKGDLEAILEVKVNEDYLPGVRQYAIDKTDPLVDIIVKEAEMNGKEEKLGELLKLKNLPVKAHIKIGVTYVKGLKKKGWAKLLEDVLKDPYTLDPVKEEAKKALSEIAVEYEKKLSAIKNK